MRRALAAVAAVLAAGCASGRVALLEGEAGAPVGAVAMLEPRTEAELGTLTAANTASPLRAFRPAPVEAGRYAALTAGLPPPPRVFTLYFLEGTTTLTAESEPELGALRTAITGVSDVQIIGHTDTVGSTADNDALSRNRAMQIQAELVKQGLPVESARVTGRGEREPLVRTGDGVAEPRNRRVEVIVR